MRQTFAILAAAIAAAEAQIAGFNYGNVFTTGAAKQQSDFEAEFSRAQDLQGATCFTAARLYTMIQAGTANTPISAIPAAISTDTQLLLGLWASAGQDIFNNEVQALQSAIDQYGSQLVDRVVGISVGSEDLYRITPTGIENNSGLGAEPDTLVSYIQQVRDAISGTAASGVPIGHVDTWTAWVNGSNNAVIEACDWLGHNGFPYFETTLSNSIDNGQQLFEDSLSATRGASQGKPVWVTETGWPVSGDESGQAVASVDNAKTYWDEVACSLLGTTNTFWYTLQDAAPDTPSPSFGIVGSDLNSAPIYQLNCPSGSSGAGFCGNGTSGGSSSSSANSASATGGSSVSSVESATAPGSTAATSTLSDLETMPTVVVPPSDTTVTNLETYPTFTNDVTATATGSASPPPYPISGTDSGVAPYPTGTGVATGTVYPTGTGAGGASGSASAPAYTGAADKISAAGMGLLAIAGFAAAL